MEISATGLDHIVLRCASVEVTLDWYTRELGLEPLRVGAWRRGEVPFPSVRVSATTIIDLIPGQDPEGRLDHICLVIEPLDLARLAASGRFQVVEGPATRWGAQGDATSLYVKDPDGLVVELRHYG